MVICGIIGDEDGGGKVGKANPHPKSLSLRERDFQKVLIAFLPVGERFGFCSPSP
jgi:hypothetical protein